jgi:HD superfamily phosphohydrolase
MAAKKSPHTEGTPPLPIPTGQFDQIEGATTKADRQEFFIPITGFAWFYPEEVAVIDHPAFQRLGRINQLGQAHLVFRGATHKRFEHVLGAVHVVEEMISAVNFNIEKARKRGNSHCAPIGKRETRFIRLGALLHDIGHVAAGHTLEDELELIGKHDADDRLDLIFDRRNWDSASGVPVDSLKDTINQRYSKYLPTQLASA